VNVQPDAAHPGFVPEVKAMLTEGVTDEVTDTVMLFDVAVVEEAQAALLVITQLTASLLAMLEFEYVGLFVPTLAPFNFH